MTLVSRLNQSHNRPSIRKRFFVVLSTILSASLVALIVAELLLKVFFPVNYRMPPKRLSQDVWRELLHRPSSIPGLAYELTPNREKYSHGSMIRINSLGMRDDEPRSKIDASVRRIAVLGDSFTFGFGIDGEYTYPNVLEKLLNERVEDGDFDVLNFGVGGYSTRDEALVLQQIVGDWDLDLIVVGYCLNDPEIDPVQPLHSFYQDVEWWQHSEVLRLCAKVKHRWEIFELGAGDYHRYLHAKDERKWKSVVAAFEMMKSLSEEMDVPILLVVFPIITSRSWEYYPYRDLHEQVTRVAIENEVAVIDLLDEFSQYDSRELMVGPQDSHPNRLGNEVAANVILRWILPHK